jgi:hypothetical protein
LEELLEVGYRGEFDSQGVNAFKKLSKKVFKSYPHTKGVNK